MCSSQSTVGGSVLLFQHQTELSFLGNHRFQFICIYFGILVSSREVFFRNVCVHGQWVWVLAGWRFCFFEPTTWTSGLNVPRQNASAHVWPHLPPPMVHAHGPCVWRRRRFCALFWRRALPVFSDPRLPHTCAGVMGFLLRQHPWEGLLVPTGQCQAGTSSCMPLMEMALRVDRIEELRSGMGQGAFPLCHQPSASHT